MKSILKLLFNDKEKIVLLLRILCSLFTDILIGPLPSSIDGRSQVLPHEGVCPLLINCKINNYLSFNGQGLSDADFFNCTSLRWFSYIIHTLVTISLVYDLKYSF